MIPNSVSNETAHVTNWILYSGCIDLDAVIARAEANAKASREWNEVTATDFGTDGDAEDVRRYRDELLTEYLRDELKDAFYDVLNETLPNYVDHFLDDELVGPVNGFAQADYECDDPQWLFLTLMAPTIRNVAFDDIAKLVREHFVPA